MSKNVYRYLPNRISIITKVHVWESVLISIRLSIIKIFMASLQRLRKRRRTINTIKISDLDMFGFEEVGGWVIKYMIWVMKLNRGI